MNIIKKCIVLSLLFMSDQINNVQCVHNEYSLNNNVGMLKLHDIKRVGYGHYKFKTFVDNTKHNKFTHAMLYVKMVEELTSILTPKSNIKRFVFECKNMENMDNNMMFDVFIDYNQNEIVSSSSSVYFKVELDLIHVNRKNIFNFLF
ncbi:hypothetical protein [Heterosigma akashiwo virus 01]|uniref:Uncharacterized protein n=1 Tax=Heterosigma akashiwo virus 01 TaxID=97195 RepID=A0A1C9C557_HAV01|nr:hypothetical protein D1R72_gp085 [Heterosigma akashiwo virus 01]AOM63416.1 hypothetical protein [Heterosigma akashiwo virus 01]